MQRRRVALSLLGVAAVAATAFFAVLFGSEPDMDAELTLSWAATMSAVWGVVLLVPDARLRRWLVVLVAGLTAVAAITLVALLRALPT